MSAPLFTVAGNPINVPVGFASCFSSPSSTPYPLLRYRAAPADNSRARDQNARELQQILVPESFPALPGFTLTSAYRPAQEVAGISSRSFA